MNESPPSIGNQQSEIGNLLARSDDQRLREYKYRFSQAVVFGLPVLALQWKGSVLGGPESDRWVGILQALLAGWVVYVGAAGMLFEGLILLRRRVVADLPPALVAVAAYLFSLASVLHVLFTGRLWYRPLLFHVSVIVVALWTGLQWCRWSGRLKRASATALTLLLVAPAARAGDPPIVITGDEQKQIDLKRSDGGLRAYTGVANIQVHRAEPGWTYNHHVDTACWKGRLYLAWDSCEKDEDVGVSREMYATSVDGFEWTEPKEMFPKGVSTALRMYFFRAPNGRMLALAGLRVSEKPLVERAKGALIVREILPDHSLGPVHLLRAPREIGADVPLTYTESSDAGFVEACNQLLANKPFLEQSDYGNLLGDRKMKWHDVNIWPADEPSRGEFARFGKGTSFYHRKDGALVAVMKWGWVLVSRDEGETWSAPTRPPTLVSGMAKAWGQRTADGRFALAYNPDLLQRFPLVIVTGDDGITFGDMRVVHGELPPIRHPGLYKVVGPQYVRGISEWSSDGSRADDVLWLAYSVGKEDIWISRVPLGPRRDAWNTYSPTLAPVTIKDDQIVLEDRDPADYAKASRNIDGNRSLTITFHLIAEGGSLGLDVNGTPTLLSTGNHRIPIDPGNHTSTVTFRTGNRTDPAAPTRFVIKSFSVEPR